MFAILVVSVSHMETSGVGSNSGVLMLLTKKGMQYGKFRSSHSQMFYKISVAPVPNPLFNRVVGLKAAILLKKTLAPVNFATFLRTSFLRIASGDCPC